MSSQIGDILWKKVGETILRNDLRVHIDMLRMQMKVGSANSMSSPISLTMESSSFILSYSGNDYLLAMNICSFCHLCSHS
jgi:hypothetical protein